MYHIAQIIQVRLKLLYSRAKKTVTFENVLRFIKSAIILSFWIKLWKFPKKKLIKVQTFKFKWMTVDYFLQYVNTESTSKVWYINWLMYLFQMSQNCFQLVLMMTAFFLLRIKIFIFHGSTARTFQLMSDIRPFK